MQAIGGFFSSIFGGGGSAAAGAGSSIGGGMSSVGSGIGSAASGAGATAGSAGGGMMGGMSSIGSGIGGAMGGGGGGGAGGISGGMSGIGGGIQGGMPGGGGGGMGLNPQEMGRMGSSAAGAASNYAMTEAQVEAARREAFDERLASRQEYIQAEEMATAIQREYQRNVGDQLAIASASGIDVSSGSMVEARRRDQEDASRSIERRRTTAQMNAKLRRSRAFVIKKGASVMRTAGGLTAMATMGNAALDTYAARG